MDGSIPIRFVLSKRTFYISLSFPSPGSFRLTVWDGKTLWVGEKSGDALTDLIPEGMKREAYFHLLKEAFSVQDKENKRFNYGIARHPTIKTDALVKWIIKTNTERSENDKKEVLIPVDLQGEIHLSVAPEDKAKKTIQGMMDVLLANRNELASESKNLRDLNEILKSQKKGALVMLEKLEQEKRAAEVELFSKFVLILNAKKAKIRDLHADLMDAKAQTVVTPSPTSSRLIPPTATTSSAKSTQQQQQHAESASLLTGGSPGDPLSVQFDSNDVHTLSMTPQYRDHKNKADAFAKPAPKAASSSASGDKPRKAPQNLFDLQSPSSLASHSSTPRLQGSQSGKLSRQTSTVKLPADEHQRAISAKRIRHEPDILASSLEDEGDDDFFLTPEPKKWKKH